MRGTKNNKSWKVDKQEKFIYLRCLLFWWWWFCFILLCFYVYYLFVFLFVLLLLLFYFWLFSSRTMMNKAKIVCWENAHHVKTKDSSPILYLSALYFKTNLVVKSGVQLIMKRKLKPYDIIMSTFPEYTIARRSPPRHISRRMFAVCSALVPVY